jgi:DNA topoisomerase-2
MDYIFEEGQKIEPKWYLPIIPMILVNGCEGIGTGWRSQLPCFNPHEIVRSLKSKLKGNGFLKLEPWYKGFQGEIKENPENKGTYIVTGKYHWDENNPRKVIITEIPIKKWTEDYKYFLQELMGIEIISRSNNEDNKSQKKKGKNNGRKKSQDKSSDDEEKQKKKKKEIMVEDLRENHTYNRVCFEVTLLDEYAKKFKQDNDLFIKTFNLQSTINIKNMVLFSPEGKLKKYNTIEEILETFYNLRLEYYHIRKDYMISVLKKEVATLSNKARFIKMVIEDELIIKKKKRAVIVNELYELKFDTQSMLDAKKQKTKEELHKELEIQNNNGENNLDQSSVIVNEEEQENKKKDEIKPKVPIKEYDYLLSMNLWSLTHEKIEELLKQKELKEKELSILEQTEVETLWDNDLDNLEEELTKYENMEEEDRLLAQKLNKGKSGGANPKRRRGGRKKKNNSGEKSEDNNSDNDNENNDSNNTSLISDSTNIITKKNKSPNKTRKTRKKKNQASITEFVEEKKDKKSNKKTDKEIDMDKGDSVSKNSRSGISSDNNKESSDDDDESSESNQFKIPLKERLRKKIIDIGESPIPLENLNYGTKIKRDFSDDSFSDLDLGYLEEKEKKEE